MERGQKTFVSKIQNRLHPKCFSLSVGCELTDQYLLSPGGSVKVVRQTEDGPLINQSGR